MAAILPKPTYQPNLVRGVLEDLETHIALREAFQAIMAKPKSVKR